jgi:transcription elongation factor SPT6
MSTMDLFDTHAELDNEEDDEDFDEETGDAMRKSNGANRGFDDSSEEEDEDDDEEAAREVSGRGALWPSSSD